MTPMRRAVLLALLGVILLSACGRDPVAPAVPAVQVASLCRSVETVAVLRNPQGDSVGVTVIIVRVCG